MDHSKYLGCIVSGIASSLIFHPIDSLRVRHFFGEITSTNCNQYRFHQQLKQYSRLFYNGIMFNIITTIVKQSASFPTQEFVKQQLKCEPILANTISGIIAGITLSLVSTPINVIKVPLMSNTESTVSSVMRCVYSRYGMSGFYRGGLGTAYRDILWNGLYFPAFSQINYYLDCRPIASMLAGVLAVCISYPFDGIRLYRQNNKDNYNFWLGFRHSFNRSPENIKSFAVCAIRVPLSVALSHYLYLMTNEHFSKKKE